jgi:predicted nucleic acid-binding protein
MNKPIRLVIDTNIIGSTLLGGQTATQFATLIQATDIIDLIYDERLLDEVRNLASVPYFQQRGIAGDKDLLTLQVYGFVKILTLTTFINDLPELLTS